MTQITGKQTPAQAIRETFDRIEGELIMDIGMKVQKYCDQFTKETGLKVRSVEVELMQTQEIGAESQSIVTRVKINPEDL